MGCPSIESAIRLTTLDLIDIRTESFPSANRHITLVCKLVAELLAAKGLFNIHEGAFKDVRKRPPPSSLHRRHCRPLFQHVFTTNTHTLPSTQSQQTRNMLVLPDEPVA